MAPKQPATADGDESPGSPPTDDGVSIPSGQSPAVEPCRRVSHVENPLGSLAGLQVWGKRRPLYTFLRVSTCDCPLSQVGMLAVQARHWSMAPNRISTREYPSEKAEADVHPPCNPARAPTA